LGPLEKRVLDAACKLKKANVRDVVERLDNEFAYTTIMTTLDRLFKKGYLERDEAQGRAYIYSPRVTQEEMQIGILGDVITGLLDNATRSVEPQVPAPPPPEPLPAPEPDQPEPPPQPAAIVAPFEAPRLPPPYRHQEEIRNAPATRWWLLVVVSVVFGVFGAVVFELWQLAREPRWVPLRLDAKTADLEGVLPPEEVRADQ